MDITEKLSFVSADDEYGAAEVPQLITDLTVVDDRLVIHRADGSEEIGGRWAGVTGNEVEKITVDERGAVFNVMSTGENKFAGLVYRRHTNVLGYQGPGLVAGFDTSDENSFNDDVKSGLLIGLNEANSIVRLSSNRWITRGGIIIESDHVDTSSLKALLTGGLFETTVNNQCTIGFYFPAPVTVGAIQLKRPNYSNYALVWGVHCHTDTGTQYPIASVSLTNPNTTYVLRADKTNIVYMILTASNFTGTGKTRLTTFNILRNLNGPASGVKTTPMSFNVLDFTVTETDSQLVLHPAKVTPPPSNTDVQNVYQMSKFALMALIAGTQVSISETEKTLPLEQIIIDQLGMFVMPGVFQVTPGKWRFSFHMYGNYGPNPGGLQLVYAGNNIPVVPYLIIRSTSTPGGSYVVYEGDFTVTEDSLICFKYSTTVDLVITSPYAKQNNAAAAVSRPLAVATFWKLGNEIEEPKLITYEELGTKLEARYTFLRGVGDSNGYHLSNSNYASSSLATRIFDGAGPSVEFEVKNHFRILSKGVNRGSSNSPLYLTKYGKVPTYIPGGILPIVDDNPNTWSPLTIPLPPGKYSIMVSPGGSRMEHKWFFEYIAEAVYEKSSILTAPQVITEYLVGPIGGLMEPGCSATASTVTYPAWKVFDGLRNTGWVSRTVQLDPMPEFFVDLRRPCSIHGYTLVKSDSFITKEYSPVEWEVLYLNASGEWVTCQRYVVGANAIHGQIHVGTLDEPVTTTKIKFRFFPRSDAPGTAISRLELIGDPWFADPAVF